MMTVVAKDGPTSNIRVSQGRSVVETSDVLTYDV